MVSERRDSRLPARVRAASASPTSTALRALPGLAGAIADALGPGHAPLRGGRAWLDACARLAEARAGIHGPPCPLRLVPVRTGRSVSGVALAPGACLSGFAAAVAANRRVPTLVHGACPPRVARAAGLRFSKRRPWPGGPERAARLERLAASVMAGFSTWCVESGGDPAWHSALVMPRMEAAGGRRVMALVVLSPSPLDVRLLLLPDATATGPATSPDLVPGLRAALGRALSEPRGEAPAISGYLPSPRSAVGLLLGQEAAKDCDDGFDYRMKWTLELSQRAALASFRRTLPPSMGSIAGMTRSGFDRPSEAILLLESRRGWTEVDHLRVLQAMRAVPWLVEYSGMVEMLDRARAGQPLEAVVRAVAGIEKPLHPKVVRCLAASWRMRRTTNSDPAIALACASLDALYRADPHHPVLAPRETRHAVEVLCALGHLVEHPAAGAAAVRALRQRGGRLGAPPAHLRDYAYWIAQTCARILESVPNHGLPREAVDAFAASVAFPPHRRLPGLADAVKAWHARIQRDAQAYAERLAAYRAEAEDAGRAEAARIREGEGVDGPAHFLSGPTEVDGVLLRPLLDAEALREEGAALGHCVGGYEWALESGHCVLLGLSSPAGRSTVEAHPHRGPEGSLLRIVQHRGVRNGEPPPGHPEALAALVASIPRETLENLEGEMEARARVARRLRALDLASLTQAQRAGLADLLMEQVRPFLSGPERNLSRPDWVAHAIGRARGLVAV